MAIDILEALGLGGAPAPAARPVTAQQVSAQFGTGPTASMTGPAYMPGGGEFTADAERGYMGAERGAQPGYFLRTPPGRPMTAPANPPVPPRRPPQVGEEVKPEPTVLARLRRGNEGMANDIMSALAGGLSQPVAETRDPWMAAANGFRAGMGGVQQQRAARAAAEQAAEERAYERSRDARRDAIEERRARAYEMGQTRRAPGAATDPFLTEQRMQSALNSYHERLGIDDLRERASDLSLSDEERADVEAQLAGAEAAYAAYEQRIMQMAGMSEDGTSRAADGDDPLAGYEGRVSPDIIEAAREAIDAGADPEAVRDRLNGMLTR